MQSSLKTCSRVQLSVCLSVCRCPFVCASVGASVRSCVVRLFDRASVVCASVVLRLFVRRPLFVRLLLCVICVRCVHCSSICFRASVVVRLLFVRLFFHVRPSVRSCVRSFSRVCSVHASVVRVPVNRACSFVHPSIWLCVRCSCMSIRSCVCLFVRICLCVFKFMLLFDHAR